jgi:uncharacterized protein (TIGR04141 family)
VTDLNCYRLLNVEGEPIADFDDAVDLEGWDLIERGPVGFDEFSVKMWVFSSDPSPPGWSGFFAIPELNQLEVPDASTVSALVLARVDGQPGLWGFSFGPAGRFLIRSGAVERGYGLRAALNLIRPADSAEEVVAASRIRSVDRKRVSQNTVRTRTQSSSPMELEGFDVDRLRDILENVSGQPADEKWGRIVVGRDSLKVSVDRPFYELGPLCREIDDVAQLADYREWCPWVDDLRFVRDADERERIRDEVIGSLRDGNTLGFDLSPPSLIDWDRVSHFQFHSDARTVKRPRFDLDHYLVSVEVDEISVERLKSRRLYALDDDGQRADQWSIWSCLVGSIEVGGKTYVLDDGDIFEIAPDFLAEVNEEIGALRPCALVLPDSQPMWQEKKYNEEASAATGLTLLDRNLISIPGRTTPIEPCDLMSGDGHLVHVKRHFVSSELSHMFNQGLVSAELLMIQGFRDRLRDKLVELGAPDHAARVADNTLRPHDWEVVYAIVGDWRGRELVEVLPFFSKLSLRHVAAELRRMDYRVSYRPIALAI